MVDPTDFYSLLSSYPDRYEGMADQLWPDWRTNTDQMTWPTIGGQMG